MPVITTGSEHTVHWTKMDSAGRYHHITPDPWRASSSLRSGLGFWYTQAVACPLVARTQQIGLRCHQERITGFAADSLSTPSAVSLFRSCRCAAALRPDAVLATWAFFTG